MAGVVVDLQMKDGEKNKALEAAIGQIEKAFGKGSVMKLGQRNLRSMCRQFQLGRLGWILPLELAAFQRVGSLKSMALNLQVKLLWRCTR